MLKKIVGLFIFLFLGLFLKPGLVNAETMTCSETSFDSSRNLQICLGGFTNANEINKVSFSASCTGSGAGIVNGTTVQCSFSQQDANLSGISAVPDNSNPGTYYGCFTLPTINPEVKSARLTFIDGSSSCTLNADTSTNASGDVFPGQNSGPGITPTCVVNGGGTGINTAVGCIPIDNQSDLIGFFLRWAIGIGGGIAFLLILFAGFQIMTSRGDPNRLKAGQELMTSAIAGLLLLIFSVIILRIIGVDILQIKGL
ncbi:MAG TPA: hypothetical protein VG895_04625 [Patescibacteria group bacterium]|nr:hypothetical protein [Patescibacteria group bacterium]